MTLRSRGFLAGASIVASLMIGTFGAVANDSVDKAVADANQWAVAGHDYGNTRYSPLKQINSENASKLSLVYSFSLASLRSNELSPIIVGKTLYVSTSWGPKYVYALDAATGARKWTYEPEIPDDVLQFACCDVNSRGVSYADGKIFVGRLDGKLTALDAETGKELWTATVVDYKQGSVITSPPLVVRDKVITGWRRRVWRSRLAAGVRHQDRQADVADLHCSGSGRGRQRYLEGRYRLARRRRRLAGRFLR